MRDTFPDLLILCGGQNEIASLPGTKAFGFLLLRLPFGPKSKKLFPRLDPS
jgi:hypothetical protein